MRSEMGRVPSAGLGSKSSPCHLAFRFQLQKFEIVTKVLITGGRRSSVPGPALRGWDASRAPVYRSQRYRNTREEDDERCSPLQRDALYAVRASAGKSQGL